MTTFARLSFWLSPSALNAFEIAFTQQVQPLLKRHNLANAVLCRRSEAKGVFSYVFVVDSPLAIPAIECALLNDSAWLQQIRALGKKFASNSADNSLRYSFDLYLTSPVTGTVVEAGAGSRAGTWQRLSVQDGLVSPIAHDFLQDKEGHLWIATVDGASCYDGARFINYTKEHGLSASSIISIAQNSAGDIWFASNGYLRNTNKGLCRYDGEMFHVYIEADGLVDNRVLSMGSARAQ